jgi:uncharacterized protein (TIGR00369 family)
LPIFSVFDALETARLHLSCVKVLQRDQSVSRKSEDATMSPEPVHQREFMTRIKANDVAIARLIGFEVKEVADGTAVITLAAGPQHANPMGTLHGGVLCDVADAAMGIAFASTLAPDESLTTVELKINFFRPVWEARLRAEGKVVRRGSTLAYTECEISDEQGRLVAKASSTCMVLRGQKAAGR